MATSDKLITAAEVAEANSNEIAGKTVLITGVSPGSLGAEAAQTIARHKPRLLVLAGRNVAKIKETADNVATILPPSQVRTLQLDLASQKQVRKAAEEVNAYAEPINILINGAGVMATPFQRTEDGLEMQFGSNHIGHFLFTNLIMPKILATEKGARVVNVTSDGHGLSPVRFDDYNFGEGEAYDKWDAYGQSKSANILFTESLVSKLGASRGLLVFSLHPGMVTTNLANHLDLSDDDQKRLETSLGKTIANERMLNLQEGAATYLTAAFDTNIASQNGSYMDQCTIRNDQVRSWAKGADTAEKLWSLSESLVGQKFQS